jgi:hypothetical protein
MADFLIKPRNRLGWLDIYRGVLAPQAFASDTRAIVTVLMGARKVWPELLDNPG